MCELILFGYPSPMLANNITHDSTILYCTKYSYIRKYSTIRFLYKLPINSSCVISSYPILIVSYRYLFTLSLVIARYH